jgi:hypothetical protein
MVIVDLQQQINGSDVPKSIWDKAIMQTFVYIELGKKKKNS